MGKIIWTDRAKKDLIHIFQYFAQTSDTYARKFTNDLVETVNKQLSIFPESGRRVPEFIDSPTHFIREVIFKNYRIIYNPLEDYEEVKILAIYSSRMDISGEANKWVLT